MDDKTVRFRGNAPGLNNPLPTGILAFDPAKPVQNQPYTLGQRRAAEAAKGRQAVVATEGETTAVVPPAVPVEPPAVPVVPAKSPTIGKQRAAALRQATPPVVPTPVVPTPVVPTPAVAQTIGQRRMAEIKGLREAKKAERIANASSNSSSTSSSTVSATRASIASTASVKSVKHVI